MRTEAVDPRQMRQFALLMGEGERYPRLIERYVETVVEPRRDVFRAVLRRGIATGELREAINIEVAVDMLTGRCWPGRGSARTGPSAGTPRRVVDELLRAWRSRQAGQAAQSALGAR